RDFHVTGVQTLLFRSRKRRMASAAGGGAAEAIRRFRDPDAERLEVIEQNTPEVLLAVLNSQGVAMVPVPSPTLLPATTTNVFLVTHGGEAVLIDAEIGRAHV